MTLKENIAISATGFVFNPSTGDSFSVNPIGHRILTLLKESKPVSEIIETILSEYHTDKDTVEKDFADYTKLLLNNKLLSDKIDE